jgi:hypothetical protein
MFLYLQKNGQVRRLNNAPFALLHAAFDNHALGQSSWIAPQLIEVRLKQNGVLQLVEIRALETQIGSVKPIVLPTHYWNNSETDAITSICTMSNMPQRREHTATLQQAHGLMRGGARQAWISVSEQNAPARRDLSTHVLCRDLDDLDIAPGLFQLDPRRQQLSPHPILRVLFNTYTCFDTYFRRTMRLELVLNSLRSLVN